MGKFIDEISSRAPAAYVQATDPATDNPTWMAKDVFWLDTTTTPILLKVRNAANNGWDTRSALLTVEQVQDIVGAMFPDVATIDWTYDDATGVVNGVVIGAAPTGTAGGDLTGTYPNPRVAQVNDANGNELLKFGTTASAVNEVTITNKATGTGPTIEATGGDTNVNLNLVSKGTGVVQANGNEVAIKNAEVNAQTGTTYTLVAADNGKVVTCSNASAITVTVPSGLGAGFNCLVVQLGAGQVTFAPSSTTVNNRQGHTKIAGQYGVATLVAYVANTFVLGGDTAS